MALTLACIGLDPPGHFVAVDGRGADHEQDEASQQVLELRQRLRRGLLVVKILPLDVGHVLTHRVERPVHVGVLAVHGRHSSPSLVGLIVGEIRKDEIRLRGHLVHRHRELAEILFEVFENGWVHFGLVRLNVRLQSSQSLSEHAQRGLRPGRLALYVKCVEHVVAWRVDGLGQLAKV